MIAKRIGFGFLALIGGIIGFVILFLIGEGTGSGLLAYAADALLFALAAYGLTRADARGWLLYALLLCAPVLAISLGGVDRGGAMLALLMAAVTIGVGYMTRVFTSGRAAAPPANTGGGTSS